MIAGSVRRLALVLRRVEVSALRLRPIRCPLCGPSLLLQLWRDESGVRCLRCRATPVHLSLATVIQQRVGDLRGLAVAELSSRGAWTHWLRMQPLRRLALSEFMPDAMPGELRNGIAAEDVQTLSYGASSFHLVTHTEVLEHVPDDTAALSELFRVLCPGGWLLFTVPLGASPTRLRARLGPQGVEHIEAPAYHGDPLRGGADVLVFRDFGPDIVDRLQLAGFTDCEIVKLPAIAGSVPARPVIVARKATDVR